VISVRCLHAGHRVDIVVADQGPGIAPAIESRLFEPFASGRANGTGLGLAMARAAAQAHRGELNYSPCSPQGAAFTLSLPVLPAI
jgi:signal transduction histidine kinase